MNKVAEFIERYLPERYQALCQPTTQTAPPVVLGVRLERGHGAGSREWSLLAQPDQLRVAGSLSDERVLTVSMSEADFEHLVLGQLSLLDQGSPMITAKVLRWDDETRRLVTAMPGSILVRIADQATTRKILLTPGLRPTDLEDVRCTIDCELNDLLAVRAGSQQIMELFFAGKLRIDGDVQLALALAGILM